MNSVEQIVWKLTIILGLVLLNGFFVAAEFAIVKVRSTQIEVLLRQGNLRARLAHNVIRHLDAYLSATQLGITISSLGLGWLGEPFVADLLNPALHRFGITSPAVTETVSFTVAFAFITFLHIVLGELAPKSLAIRKPQQTTMWVAAPLIVFYKVLFPFIWVLNHAANFVLRLVGIRPVTEGELAHSKEELQMLFVEAHAGRQVSALAKALLMNALDLRARHVSQILVPRPKVEFLSTKNTLAENLEVAEKAGYSRFPLCDGDLDNTFGMVHIKDLLRLARQSNDTGDLLSIKRDVLFVPESTVLETLLTSFLSNRRHMAIVVDEYGGTAGIVTLEDVLEELVGEIQDEFDQETPLIVKVSEHEYLVDGTTPVHELEGQCGLVLDSTHASTIGGYFIEYKGRLPSEGETFLINGWEILIKKVRNRRIQQLQLRKLIRNEDS